MKEMKKKKKKTKDFSRCSHGQTNNLFSKVYTANKTL